MYHLFIYFSGCWAAWEAGMCLSVGVAVTRWCVEVWASAVMAPLLLGPETMYRICRNTSPGDEELLPPVIIKAAPSYRHGSSSVILCEFIQYHQSSSSKTIITSLLWRYLSLSRFSLLTKYELANWNLSLLLLQTGSRNLKAHVEHPLWVILI